MLIRINGIPCGRKRKTRGDMSSPSKWKEAVIAQTASKTKIDYPCEIKVEFIIQHNQCPKDRPFGPDVDNLLKVFLDILQETILEDDNLVIKLSAAKRVHFPYEKPGVILNVTQYDVGAEPASDFQK